MPLRKVSGLISPLSILARAVSHCPVISHRRCACPSLSDTRQAPCRSARGSSSPGARSHGQRGSHDGGTGGGRADAVPFQAVPQLVVPQLPAAMLHRRKQAALGVQGTGLGLFLHVLRRLQGEGFAGLQGGRTADSSSSSFSPRTARHPADLIIVPLVVSRYPLR